MSRQRPAPSPVARRCSSTRKPTARDVRTGAGRRPTDQAALPLTISSSFARSGVHYGAMGTASSTSLLLGELASLAVPLFSLPTGHRSRSEPAQPGVFSNPSRDERAYPSLRLGHMAARERLPCRRLPSPSFPTRRERVNRRAAKASCNTVGEVLRRKESCLISADSAHTNAGIRCTDAGISSTVSRQAKSFAIASRHPPSRRLDEPTNPQP